MATSENLNSIYVKTYLTFGITLFCAIIIGFIYSVFQYNIIEKNFINIQYNFQYILSHTFYLVFKYFIYIAAFAFVYLFSTVINKTDLIFPANQKVLFSQIASKSIILLSLSTVIFTLHIEFFSPALYNTILELKEKTKLSSILLTRGHQYFKQKNHALALLYYEQYNGIIKDNAEIKDRIRELRLKTNYQSGGMALEDQYLLPDSTDYITLARYFDQQNDYLTAWFYYQYIAENDSVLTETAQKKIDSIKEILMYSNSMLDDEQKSIWLSEKEKEIKAIYQLRKKAKTALDRFQFHQSYFLYQDILAINPKIKDAIIGQDQSIFQLSNISIETSKIINAQIYPGKKDFVFMADQNRMVYIKNIKKVPDIERKVNTYYLYDTYVYLFDERGEVESIVYAPYGESKKSNLLTLYSYLATDRSLVYYPIIMRQKSSLFETHFISHLNEKDKKFIQALYRSENGYYSLKKEVTPAQKIKLGRLLNQSDYNLFDFIPLKISVTDYENLIRPALSPGENDLFNQYYNLIQEDYFLAPDITPQINQKIWKILKKTRLKLLPYFFRLNINLHFLYHFTYDYERALAFPLVKLFSLKDFSGQVEKLEQSFTFGINNNFIKTAIADKISSIFIFFYINIFFISIAWRLRSQTMDSFSMLHLLVIPFILFFIILVVKTLLIYNTLFYSILSYALNFNLLLLICFIINISITFLTILFMAGTKME